MVASPDRPDAIPLLSASTGVKRSGALGCWPWIVVAAVGSFGKTTGAGRDRAYQEPRPAAATRSPPATAPGRAPGIGCPSSADRVSRTPASAGRPGGSSPISSGSSRCARAVEATKSANMTVSCRRSAFRSRWSGDGGRTGTVPVGAEFAVVSAARRAAIASSNLRRCPTEATPRPVRSSAVSRAAPRRRRHCRGTPGCSAPGPSLRAKPRCPRAPPVLSVRETSCGKSTPNLRRSARNGDKFYRSDFEGSLPALERSVWIASTLSYGRCEIRLRPRLPPGGAASRSGERLNRRGHRCEELCHRRTGHARGRRWLRSQNLSTRTSCPMTIAGPVAGQARR